MNLKVLGCWYLGRYRYGRDRTDAVVTSKQYLTVNELIKMGAVEAENVNGEKDGCSKKRGSSRLKYGIEQKHNRRNTICNKHPYRQRSLTSGSLFVPYLAW